LAGDGYLVEHSSYLYLMDPQGMFVRGLDAGAPGDRLAEKLREIMRR
jgi:protein SCO1/2